MMTCIYGRWMSLIIAYFFHEALVQRACVAWFCFGIDDIMEEWVHRIGSAREQRLFVYSGFCTMKNLLAYAYSYELFG